jgi:hypothetical protein
MEKDSESEAMGDVHVTLWGKAYITPVTATHWSDRSAGV